MGERLRDKVALVVGAGSVGEGWGNGKAAAVLYAREGAEVFAADVNRAAAEATRSIIEGEGGNCVTGTVDAIDSASVKAMVDDCRAQFGRIDVLHNNVGGSEPGGPVEMAEEVFDANMDLNLKSAFLTCKHVLPLMQAQGGGAVVNISSVAGIRCIAGRNMVAYHASKAALIQFTRAVAIQYVRDGIRANCVLPGLMNTPLVTHRVARQYNAGEVERTIAERDAMCPTGKMGDAWDVAHAALFLASDEARYVTATELIVDGGLTAV